MKYLIPVLFCALAFISCLPNNEEETSVFEKDNFITIEGSIITDTVNAAAINSWYTTTYFPKMAAYPGLEGAYLFQSSMVIQISAPSVDFLEGNLAVYKSSNLNNLAGLSTSAQAADALTALATQYPNGEIFPSWSVTYQKVKSWENPDAEKPMLFLTMVPTVAAAGFETAVDEWETNKHVPDHMASQNLSRVVRYKKVAGTETGVDASGMAEYIEIFYYATEAQYTAHSPTTDPVFAAAEADREATWLNNELTFPWIYKGTVTSEIK